MVDGGLYTFTNKKKEYRFDRLSSYCDFTLSDPGWHCDPNKVTAEDESGTVAQTIKEGVETENTAYVKDSLILLKHYIFSLY